MPKLSFRAPAGDSFENVVGEIPAQVRRFLASGLHLLAAVAPEKLGHLFEHAVRTLSDFEPNENAIASDIGLAKESVSPVLSAASMIVGLVSSREETEDEVIKALIAKGMVEEADSARVGQFVTKVRESRSVARAAFDRMELVSEVLPMLESFETAVDIRLSHHGAAPGIAAPVLVVHLDTDAPHQELWFQMSTAQVENLIDKLQRVRDHMNAAEQLALRCVEPKE